MEVRPVSTAPDPMRLRTALDLWDQVVEDWCLAPEESLRLLGYSDGRHLLRDSREVAVAADRLCELVEFAPLAAELLGGVASVRLWLRRPNRNLGGERPIDRLARDPALLRAMNDGLRRIP